MRACDTTLTDRESRQVDRNSLSRLFVRSEPKDLHPVSYSADIPGPRPDLSRPEPPRRRSVLAPSDARPAHDERRPRPLSGTTHDSPVTVDPAGRNIGDERGWRGVRSLTSSPGCLASPNSGRAKPDALSPVVLLPAPVRLGPAPPAAENRRRQRLSAPPERHPN